MEVNDNKLLKIARKYMSNSNKNKMIKMAKYAEKLTKKTKENEFVTTRDMIVYGLVILGNAQVSVDKVVTNASGRDKLKELLLKVEQAFKEETK